MKQTAQANRRPRILVVDDTPDNLFLLDGLLGDRYDVVQAASGHDAVRVVMSATPPDLLLLDIMMPDMDGYEVLRRIRQHPPTAALPVIFITALAAPTDKVLGMELGAIDYLTKPVDPHELVRRVEMHVRATIRARRVEALSEKLARCLPSEDWERLFTDLGQDAILFDQKELTVLYADAVGGAHWSERERDRFSAEIEWLATRHQGTVDRYVDGATVVFFEDPMACLRMAMDLQRSVGELHLGVGVHSGACDVAMFRTGQVTGCTLVGNEIALAARVAATAAAGSIAVSPETYQRVHHELAVAAAGCLLMEEFHDSDLAQVSLTPAPAQGGAAASTFAGLGLR